MNKKLKVTLIILAIICLAGFAGYQYVMKGGARNLETEDAVFTTGSKQLIGEFITDNAKASAKYLNKAIAINGTVTAVNGKDISIDEKIIATLQDSLAIVKPGQHIALKGRVVGYDDLMEDIRLDQCFITK